MVYCGSHIVYCDPIIFLWPKYCLLWPTYCFVTHILFIVTLILFIVTDIFCTTGGSATDLGFFPLETYSTSSYKHTTVLLEVRRCGERTNSSVSLDRPYMRVTVSHSRPALTWESLCLTLTALIWESLWFTLELRLPESHCVSL
jgi:hypothetical protein